MRRILFTFAAVAAMLAVTAAPASAAQRSRCTVTYDDQGHRVVVCVIPWPQQPAAGTRYSR